MDFDDTIMYLILEGRRRPELLEKACEPAEDARPNLVVESLLEGRRDLERVEKRGVDGEAA
ncbi:MAG: hypothetical protein KIH01_08785 [Candidatus Freyarchaeota archaeon]|nr:hypothetical protein [Candidatus Jordarchaeia archaeon]